MICGHTECALMTVTWSNVVQCVTNELFPVLSVKINECVQEKLLMESTFKLSDVGNEAVKDIMNRLMTKRTMNNKEMEYLDGLIQRAIESPRTETGHALKC